MDASSEQASSGEQPEQGTQPLPSAPAVYRTAEPQGEAQASDGPVDDQPEQPASAAPQANTQPSAPSGDAETAPHDGPSPPTRGEAPPAVSAAPRTAGAESRKQRQTQQKQDRRDQKLQKAFREYFDYREDLRRIPPRRVLAINRGERSGLLRVAIEADLAAMERVVDELCVPAGHPHAEFLRGCARDALHRLIVPSLEHEARRELTERAEAHAVEVFGRDLRDLLLSPPVRDRRVLGIDPGSKSGCKLAALDQFGNHLASAVIHLVGRPERREEAKRTVAEMVERFELSLIVIGNGRACRETERFIAELLTNELKDRGLAYVVINEAGADVYATSRLGREELPQCTASARGAVSIGRRVQDPLAELVKIEPANIGVGVYQHDVKAKHFRAALEEVVESCVNEVGVDVNTAGPALLAHVSGLNQLTARRLYEHRLQNGPFRSREQLKEVPGIGEATFVQAAGFLKIVGGDNPLDATRIHPESYGIAHRVMEKLGIQPADLVDPQRQAQVAGRVAKVDVRGLATELGVGELLLEDILGELARPGHDPRDDLPPLVFRHGMLKLEDLQPGMALMGTVLNVVDFGAFIDLGMPDSGLVHVSQLAHRYVRDPYEILAVGDIVRVWVVDVDKARRRISLTMIPPGAQRPGWRPDRRTSGQPSSSRPARPEHGRAQAGPGRAAEARAAPAGSSTTRRVRPKPPAQEQPASAGPAAQAPRTDRPTRGDRGGGRHAGHGSARPAPSRKTHSPPKSRPKPVIPISEAMKAGKEPMRSFSDLLQYYAAKGGIQAEPPRRQTPKAPGEPASPKTAEPSSGAGHEAGAQQSPAAEAPDEPARPAEPPVDLPKSQPGPSSDVAASPAPGSVAPASQDAPSSSLPLPAPPSDNA